MFDEAQRRMEIDVDRLRAENAQLTARLRAAAQLGIAELGADGPEDAESVVGRLVSRIHQLKSELERYKSELSRLLDILGSVDHDHAVRKMGIENEKLKAELAQCQQREARLRDLLQRSTAELVHDIEMAGDCGHEVGICCCSTKWLLRDAQQALKEAS